MPRFNLKTVLGWMVVGFVVSGLLACSPQPQPPKHQVDMVFYDWCMTNLGNDPAYCCPHAGGDEKAEECQKPSDTVATKEDTPASSTGTYHSPYEGLPREIPGNGDFPVGDFISPGTWITQGSSGGVCRWWTSKFDSDEHLDEGIAEHPSYAQVVAFANIFHTEHCLPWRPVS